MSNKSSHRALRADARLAVRVPHRLASQVRRKARREGVKVSTALRRMLLLYAGDRSAPVELARTLAELTRELRAIGRNLNQVTHAIHAGYGPGGYTDVTAELARIVRRLATAMQPLALTRREDERL